MQTLQDARSKLLANSYSPKYRSNAKQGNRGIIIPANVAGNLPLTMIYPRPDNETNINARHRVNYPGQPYIVPVGVSGEGYPYTYQLVDAPDGMTIGSFLDYDNLSWVRRPNSGVITWYKPVSGTYTFTIIVTNVFGENVSTTITLVVSTNWNILNTKLPTNGNGTINSPYNTIASITNNKPTLVMDGCIVDLDLRPGNMSIMTRTWVSEYGKRAIMLQGNSAVTCDQDDVYFGGFWFGVPKTRLGVGQLLKATTRSRITFYDNIIGYHNNAFTGGAVPASSVFQLDASNGLVGNANNYLFMHSNVFNGVVNRSLLNAYNVRDSLVEANVMIANTDTSGLAHGFWFRDFCSNITYRDNKQLGDLNTQSAITVDNPSASGVSTNIDIVYNHLRCFANVASNPNGLGAIKLYNLLASGSSERCVKRNTIYTPTSSPIYAAGNGDLEILNLTDNALFYNQHSLDNNLITQNGIKLAAGYSPMVQDAGVVSGLYANNYIDINGKFIGVHSVHRGVAGSEIA